MHEVELVEGVDEPEPTRPGAADDGAPADGGGPSWIRRNVRRLAPIAALAVLALVGTQLVVDARERARLEALAAIPGVVPPTGPDIGVIWRADPALGRVLQTGASIDGAVVGGKVSGTGTAAATVDLVAIDTDTGAVRWTTPVQLPAADVTPGGGPASPSVGCMSVTHAGRVLAACEAQQYGDGLVATPDSATWVVDPSDGAVLDHSVVPGGAAIAFTDDALVVTHSIAPDSDEPAPSDAGSVRWRATATDLVSGATLWTYTTPVLDAPVQVDGSGAANASLQPIGDRIILGVDGHAWILGAGGTLERDVPLQPGTWVQGVRSGVLAESSYTSTGVYTDALLLPDGTSVPTDEIAGGLSVDDGSAPGVVFTVGSQPSGSAGLSGRDATTGKVLWHRGEPVSAGLLLHGVLYLVADQSIEAVDATTGRTRWSTTLDFQPQQLSTDGRYLLVPALATSLRAYKLSDGRLGWTKELRSEVAGDRSPVYIQGFQAGIADPRLYVWMDDGAVAVLG